DDGILWTFGTRNIRIAQIFKMEPFTHYDEIFRNRLQLDTQTGSLTIHNISITHSGVYKLQIISNDVSTKQFNVTVYARLPVPNITRASHSKRKSSISLTCPVLCSVDSVNKVTLSWYKGNHVISTISDSKTSSLFLPLEVEYHDKNTYSCVASNPVSNQTALLIITNFMYLSPNSPLYHSPHCNIVIFSTTVLDGYSSKMSASFLVLVNQAIIMDHGSLFLIIITNQQYKFYRFSFRFKFQ
uniref:Ig-like domain-containing protein n=1 Tax=Electrophorus electricus TaxID=8005 RepID=A0A4W4E1U2_ELEEL